MLPAWMIDQIKKDEELSRRNGERHIDQPARAPHSGDLRSINIDASSALLSATP
jgi:hypothetical protein